jgi:methylenetetrahydrofolate reductase (NADPH)
MSSHGSGSTAAPAAPAPIEGTPVAELLAAGPTVSFEFFPPRTEEASETLRRTIVELAPLEPSFVSVTYGAGGSTRDLTHRLVVDLLADGINPVAHLTAVEHTLEELTRSSPATGTPACATCWRCAATRRPASTSRCRALEHAIDLVHLVRRDDRRRDERRGRRPPRGASGGDDTREDRRHLAAKLEAADFAVTQFFFEADDYLRLVEDLAALGCTKPVLPGIMPVTNLAQIERFAALSGATFPRWLAERLHAVGDDPAAVRAVGVEVATELCAGLMDAGAPGLHFYTLNRSTATREVAANLGIGEPVGLSG